MCRNVIGGMPANEKLDGANYDIWSLKVQFFLNDEDVIDLSTCSMLACRTKTNMSKILLLVSSTKKN